MNRIDNGWMSSYHDFQYFKFGSYTLLIEWPTARDEATLNKIRNLSKQIEQLKIDGIKELVPTYHSLAIYFEPNLTTHSTIIDHIESLSISISKEINSNEIYEIPVSYDDKVARDLSFVSDQVGLSKKEIIQLHSEPIYVVHFIGFLPGFLYLGGLDDRLILPRRETPRIRVPSGSVALAAGQTGIYPVDSPGGWHIIGHTMMEFFQPGQIPPCPFEAGARIKFEPV